MNLIARATLLALLVALPTSLALGQSSDAPDPGQMALELSNLMKANTKTLGGYTWENTLELIKDGETVSRTVNQVLITPDGKPEMTLVSQEPEQEEQKRLRGKRQDKEREYLESLVELAMDYTNPATGDLVELFEGATFAHGAGEMEGYIQVQGKGFIQEGDEVTMWIQSVTLLPHTTEFRTKLDGDAVVGTVSYGHVSEDGPFYVSKQDVTVEDKKLEAIIQNSNHAVAE